MTNDFDTPPETRLQRGQREMREKNAAIPPEASSDRLRKDLRLIKRSVRDWLDTEGINPVNELVILARRASDAGLLDIACRAWDSVCKLSYPKLSTVQVSGHIDSNVDANILHKIMESPAATAAAETIALMLADEARQKALGGTDRFFHPQLPSEREVIELKPIEDFQEI